MQLNDITNSENMRKLFLLGQLSILGLMILYSCSSPKIKSISEYLYYINNKDNGLFIEKSSEDYEFSVKFLSPEYLALQELNNMQNVSQISVDSLINMYTNNLTFIFSVEDISPIINQVQNKSEKESTFQNKVNALNMSLRDCFVLKTRNCENRKLILGTMENTGSLNGCVNYYLVFQEMTDNTNGIADEFTLEFRDIIFNTGESNFQFQRKDIDNIPKFNFEKYTKF